MREVFLGEYIKRRRLELGLSQEQLSAGVCSMTTLSRLENGRQTPSRSCIGAILQRLGLPDDRYFALLTSSEQQIAGLQKEIVSCNVREDSEHGLMLLQYLERLMEPDDNVLHQFILRSRVLLGKKEGESIRPYSIEERLDMLMTAIRLTSPSFDLNHVSCGLYSLDEAKVINLIAITYSLAGQHEKATDIYCQLLEYIQTHFLNILQSGGLLPLVAYNYARELALGRRYNEAIRIAQLGWDACVKYGQYSTLPNTLAVMAECYHFLGEEEKSKQKYLQSYYICYAVDNLKSVNIIKEEMKQYHNIQPEF